MAPTPSTWFDPRWPIDALDWARLLYRRKWVILLATCLGTLVGMLLVKGKEPVFQSSAQVVVFKKPRASAFAESNSLDATYYEDFLVTHQMLLTSRAVVSKAVEQGQLKEMPLLRDSSDPAGLILAGLTVRRLPADVNNAPNVLELSFRSQVAADSQPILSQLLVTYQQFLVDSYRNVGEQILTQVNEARNVLAEDLARKKKEYQEFLQSAPILRRGKEGSNLFTDRLLVIEEKRASFSLARTETQTKLTSLQEAMKSGIRREVLEAAASEFRAKLGEAAVVRSTTPTEQRLQYQLELTRLLKDYGPDYSGVQYVKKQIENVDVGAAAKTSLLDAVELYVMYLEQELRDQTANEKALTELYQKEQLEARKLIDYEIREEALRTDIASLQELFNSSIKRLQEIDLTKNYGGYDVRIILPPGEAIQVEPRALQWFVMGTCFGFGIGLVLAWTVDQMDPRFSSLAEIRNEVNAPVLGQAPEPPHTSLAPRLLGMLPRLHEPESAEAEAFRSLRTALFARLRSTDQKVLQIAQPSSEGQSAELAVNLAVAVAQAGRRVLLIDADLRTPQLHQVLDLKNDRGLSQVLAGEFEYKTVCQAGPLPLLQVLSAGPSHAQPVELLSNPRLAGLFEEASERFDLVLVLTPPLMGRADAGTVAATVDGVVLDVPVGRGVRRATQWAAQFLSELEVPLVGVVLSGTQRQLRSLGYLSATSEA